MRSTFPEALQMVLKHEGGWADHPADPGGATMKGVTLQTFNAFLGREASKDELRAITDKQLHDIYSQNYWAKARCDELPVGVDASVFDVAVNSGSSRAAKLLQASLGLEVDGIIGAKTLGAANAVAPAELIARFAEARRSFYRKLATFPIFGKGWLRRVDEVEAQAYAILTANR
ncbi:MAG: hypothetical protein EBT04_02390 [Betaproteobacteria bacterium]|jgi:lysozyme family protein|nr:hypothetical protein [Betaproteobacteria bacterium]